MPEKNSPSKVVGKNKATLAKSVVSTRKPVATKATPAKTAPVKAAVIAKTEKKNPEKKIKKANDKVDIKVKVIRDSFTMPQNDYAKIGELKQACHKVGLQVKKSELLRAGLHVLSKLTVEQLKKTIVQIEQIKTGRPKKS